jgi:methoxymalonate biosynthesis acyl carrier protein
LDARNQIRTYIKSKVAHPLEDGDDIFDLGLVDSLFGLQLVSFVEQEFGIAVSGDDLDIANFCSIDALTAFVTAKGGADGTV